MRKFVVNVNGNSYQVEVEEVGGSASASTAPTVSSAAEASPVPAKPVVKGSGTELKAPMPGMVVRFLVNDGASVKKGQGVIVLEAMKMENEIAASADGVITFAAQKGANVDTGAVLAYIG
jgi:biotin carboxyl carrier protein